MKTREIEICFGVREFFNEAFEACRACPRLKECGAVIHGMSFEVETSGPDPEIPVQVETDPEPENGINYKKIAPNLRGKNKGTIDFRPIIDAILEEKPVNGKAAAAIVRRFGVNAQPAYGYAGTILNMLGIEGFYTGKVYEKPTDVVTWG